MNSGQDVDVLQLVGFTIQKRQWCVLNQLLALSQQVQIGFLIVLFVLFGSFVKMLDAKVYIFISLGRFFMAFLKNVTQKVTWGWPDR